tara:strand:+ start:2848 stop:3093 length:246 start_codon:yes stop_codon:yes gene_type:complete
MNEEQEKIKNFLKDSPYPYETITNQRDYITIKFAVSNTPTFTQRKAEQYKNQVKEYARLNLELKSKKMKRRKQNAKGVLKK